MPTRVEMRLPDGDIRHLRTSGPHQAMHAYTEAGPGVVHESFMVFCSGDQLQADIFKIKDTEAIVDPEDSDEIEDLCTQENHYKTLLRSANKEIPMTDFEVGSFVLIVTHLVEDDSLQTA